MHNAKARFRSFSRRFALLACAALAVFVVACSNADPAAPDAGGGGTTDSGSSDAGPSLGYYPMVDGARWTYVHKPANLGPDDCNSTCWNETVTLAATEYAGEPAFRSSDDGNAPDMSSAVAILARVGTAAMRVHKIDEEMGVPVEDVTYDPGFPRFDDAWLDLATGTMVSTEYARIALDLTVEPPTEGVDVRIQQFVIEGREDVEVPAGSFRDCLKVRRLREASVGDAGTSGSIDEKEKRFWFCDGVGKVREDSLTTDNQELLLSCDVPGGACPG
jgi:hypothetical protein